MFVVFISRERKWREKVCMRPMCDSIILYKDSYTYYTDSHNNICGWKTASLTNNRQNKNSSTSLLTVAL